MLFSSFSDTLTYRNSDAMGMHAFCTGTASLLTREWAKLRLFERITALSPLARENPYPKSLLARQSAKRLAEKRAGFFHGRWCSRFPGGLRNVTPTEALPTRFCLAVRSRW